MLHEHFHRTVHVAFLIKPENFWQKQRTSLGKQKKYNFEVSRLELRMYLTLIMLGLLYIYRYLQFKLH